MYDPVVQKEGVLFSRDLHDTLCRTWRTFPSWKDVSGLPLQAGKSFLQKRIEEKTILLQPEYIDLDNYESDEEEDDSTRTIFQRFKGNFGIVALEFVAQASEERELALRLYSQIMNSTLQLSVKRDQYFSLYSADKIISLLEFDGTGTKESFPVAGSLKFDVWNDRLYIQTLDPSIVIILKSNLSLLEMENLAKFNAFDKSGHKQLWTCVYRLQFDRVTKGLRLKNVCLVDPKIKYVEAKEALVEAKERGESKEPSNNRYNVLYDGMCRNMLLF